MNEIEPKEKKNLLIEMAKRKAADNNSGVQHRVLGKDLAFRIARSEPGQSYKWRGGRNGSGKP